MGVIYALGKAHNYSLHPSLRSFPNFAFETVPMFVWLTMALARPFKEDRLALPLSTPLSSFLSLLKCCFTSTETVGLFGTGSPGRPPRLSHSSWALMWDLVECCFTSTETVGLLGTGSPGRPPRPSHSSWALSPPAFTVLSEVANSVGGQLRRDEEYSVGVTNSGRVWRKQPESDAQSVASGVEKRVLHILAWMEDNPL